MKRVPKIGDVIMIGTSTVPKLVVECDKVELSANLFTHLFRFINEDKTGVVNAKQKSYFINDAIDSLPSSTKVSLNDIHLIDHIKIKKAVLSNVTYNRK